MYTRGPPTLDQAMQTVICVAVYFSDSLGEIWVGYSHFTQMDAQR